MPFDPSGRYYDDGSEQATKRDIQNAVSTIAESRASIQSHIERTAMALTDTVVWTVQREVNSGFSAVAAFLLLNVVIGIVNLGMLAFLLYEFWWQR